MSSYSSDDFRESMNRVNIDPITIAKVIGAWGNVDVEGRCCDECGGEWNGGFLLLLKDGRYAYVQGWCDYTGWGCQDGAEVTYYGSVPSIEALQTDADKLSAPPNRAGWDFAPADLNNGIERERHKE